MRKLLYLIPICISILIFTPTPAYAIKIVIDAGHGGANPGAIGINGLYEKDVNLDISIKLQEKLSKHGYKAILTRENDQYLSLQGRVDFTNLQNADLFISIHGNDHPNPQIRGSLVLYYDHAFPQASYPANDQMKLLSPISKLYAQQVLHSFTNKLHTVDQGIVPSSVFVVRSGTIPSVLIETAFLSNAEDAELLADPATRSLMADAIADGIMAFRPLVLADIYGHWGQASILSLKEQGVVDGDAALYYPDRALTRAELLTLLDRIKPFPDLKEAAQPAVFTDLNTSHWAYKTLLKAAAAGYLGGYKDGSIKPDQAVTRGEAAVLLAAIVEETVAVSGFTGPFNDVPDHEWYAASVNHLQSLGIIQGTAPGLFEPNKSITRAEIAVLLDRWQAKNR